MAHLLAYPAGLSDHGSPLEFPTCSQLTQIHRWWPTSLVGGERPVVASSGVKGHEKISTHIVRWL